MTRSAQSTWVRCQLVCCLLMGWYTDVPSVTLLVDDTLGAGLRPGSEQSVLRWSCWSGASDVAERS